MQLIQVFKSSNYIPFGARLLHHYVQGQSPKPNIREYFYYIDHQGQVLKLQMNLLNRFFEVIKCPDMYGLSAGGFYIHWIDDLSPWKLDIEYHQFILLPLA